MSDIPPLTQSIGQAENALRTILANFLVETKTTYAQWVALNMIARGGSSVKKELLGRQLSAALKIDETTVRATFNELTIWGLATTSPGDPTCIEMTTVGETRYRSLRQNVDSVTQRLFGDLPEDELATTHRVLEVITERANSELARQRES